MRAVVRIILVGTCCVAIALGVVAWITGLEWWGKSTQSHPGAPAVSTDACEPPPGDFPGSQCTRDVGSGRRRKD